MRTNPFTLPTVKPAKLGPEHNPWYWHPNRVGVRFAPAWFQSQLHELDPNLEVTWNPINERWQVWTRMDKLQHPICQGWRLLFVHHDSTHSYLPLDERVFARVYQIDASHQGSAKEYFNRIVQEMERDKEKREKRFTEESIDLAMPSFEHAQIKVSGYGPSKGSKFATYHSGI